VIIRDDVGLVVIVSYVGLGCGMFGLGFRRVDFLTGLGFSVWSALIWEVEGCSSTSI